MNITSPKIQLLSRISEVDILRHYMPSFDPNHTGNYTSPFATKDDKPSLNFYQKNGSLMFKSHNTGHQGDIFQFVADLKGIDCKTDFQALIAEMQQDLALSPPLENQAHNIRISYERQAPELISYFTTFGVSAELLDRYHVRQVKYHEFITRKGKHCKFDYRKLGQLAIGYAIEDRVKVYFPKIEGKQEKLFGFKDQTSADIFGLAQLGPTVSRLFISAGEKDCLVLNAHGFPAVSFQSENTLPTGAQIDQLNSICKEIIIVFDSDQPGINAAVKLSEKTGWKSVQLPTETKDVADYFLRFKVSDFEKLIEKAATSAPSTDPVPEVYTIFHQSEDFLKKHFDFRYNTVSLDIEVSKKNANAFQVANENQLFITMNKSGIKISIDKLICILKSDFVPHYNPVTTYFEKLPKWDKEDHIGNLASHLHAEHPTQLHVQFKKWLIRCVRCAMEPGYYNKQAFILVHSQQNSGKTTFCRFLCPPALSNYIAENISDDKDSRIALVKNFLINLDELSSLARHEINSLKALFSKDCINERLPYDRKNSIIPRIANFIGSTNMAEFLADETGSVRWLCFEIHKIDWRYKQTIDINKVWAQAYELYKSGFAADMDPKEIAENENRNAKFQQRSTEAELIPQHLQPSTHSDPLATFMTASDVLVYLTIHTPLKLNKIMIGRAMPMCGFLRTKDSTSDRYGYYCIKLN
jgi:hypothetical protein